MSKHLSLVPRISADERTVAVVQWEGVKPDMLLNTLTKALTEWVDTTEEGKAAWEASSNDFNVGDLSNYVPADDDLARILNKHGIRNLTVETFVDLDGDGDWTYDTVLVDESDFSDDDEGDDGEEED